MRASDILESSVFDSEGRKIGQVHDIRMVREAPVQGLFGQSYVAQGLVVGPAAIGIRLGFDRSAMVGPWPLKRLFEWAHRNARFVDWERIASIAEGEIRLNASLADLREVPNR
jgi:sporulation protein YlmC with PRC-barrel domain